MTREIPPGYVEQTDGSFSKLPRGGIAVNPTVGISDGSESVLHDAIIAHCKSNGWIYFHGSMAHKAMRTVGEPDFTLLLPAGRVLFIECKTRTGKLSAEQLGLKMWAEKLGHTVHVVRSVEEFRTITG